MLRGTAVESIRYVIYYDTTGNTVKLFETEVPPIIKYYYSNSHELSRAFLKHEYH